MIFIYPVTHSSLEIEQKYGFVCPRKKRACGGLCIYFVLAMALKSSIGFSLIGPKISILVFLNPNKVYFPNNRFFFQVMKFPHIANFEPQNSACLPCCY